MATVARKLDDASGSGAGNSTKAAEAPRFSVKHMDTSADPRQNFYQYAAGEWIRTNPVPSDKSVWDSFRELNEWNLVQLNKIAEESASNKATPRGLPARLVGDFYTSAMDTARIEGLKFAPIEDIWQRISQIGSTDEMMRLVPELHTAGVSVMFRSTADTDAKNSSIYAFYLVQGGLSLPDREYYLSDSFKQIRADFLDHVTRMFVLKGTAEDQARRWAGTILEIETELAKASRTRVELRDEEKNYNRTDTPELDAKYGAMRLTSYMGAVGVPPTQYVVVGQPEFFSALNEQLGRRSVDEWKVYLHWHALTSYAGALHKEVDDENFDFYGRKLTGQQQPEDRWKRAVRAVDSRLGDALGKLYVERHFTDDVRRKADEMISDILEVFRERLQKLPWMSDATRQQALAKLDKFAVKIGHTVKFKDYTTLTVDPQDYVGNLRRSAAFERLRKAARVGQPVDRTEWQMTPPTVNAYYSPTENEIVFPAGVLQPPFFDARMDDAVNYGAMGAVISHEITHGFDDQGRLFDAQGNLHGWWTPDDEKEFKARAASVVQAYGSQEAMPGRFINGELTLGENIADFGGVSIAYEALQRRLARDPSRRKIVDSLTPEQRFFIAYAQVWRQSIKEQEAIRRLTVDPHSPNKYRAILPATNHPEFDAAFPPGQNPGSQQKPKIGVW